jgi:hypothetical protein
LFKATTRLDAWLFIDVRIFSMDVYPGAPENNMMLPTTVPRGCASSFNFGDHTNSTFNYAPLANHNCEVEIAVSGQGDDEGLLLRTVDNPGRVPLHARSSIEI